MPITVIAGSYPNIETIFNETRVHVNDTFAGLTSTVGEGRVFTDGWTPSITILNLALQALQRDLETYGLPTTRELTYVTSLLPINGPLGLSIPDPSVVAYLSFDGYWDGTTLHATPTLPLDLLVPLKIRTRISGTTNFFVEFHEAPDGLPSVAQSALGLGRWEWFRDRINFNGSLANIDIELRYTGGVAQFPTTLNPNLFPTTLIPFLDSGDALSYKCAYIFCSPRAPKEAVDELESSYEQAMLNIANRWIKVKPPQPVAPAPQGP